MLLVSIMETACSFKPQWVSCKKLSNEINCTMFTKIMDIISTLLSVVMIIIGLVGLIISGGDGYYWGALIIGAIWLGLDILCIRRHQENGDYDW